MYPLFKQIKLSKWSLSMAEPIILKGVEGSNRMF